MIEKVFVTGMGIITGIGNGLTETLSSVYQCRTGIEKIKYLKTRHSDSFPSSEVKFTDDEMINMLGINPQGAITRTALIGMIAAKEAVENAGITDFSDVKTALISGTTVGGMEKSELYYKDFQLNSLRDSYIETHDCGESTERIADMLKIKDFVSTTSTACSSAANSIMLGTRLIKSGFVKRAIVGGAECLSKYHLNGFNTLFILDKEICKPFDKNRAGLNLGEGAAFLVLEAESVALKNNRKIYCRIAGYGNACEAYHQTASSAQGDGAYAAMNIALNNSGLQPSEVAYINAHGTGTANNDLSEGIAIQRIFGKKIPPVSSTKSFTGHTTSAAGGVEAVLSILAMQENILLPNLNFANRMDELSFEPVRELIKKVELKNIMSNSFGFGGNNTSLIFSKV